MVTNITIDPFHKSQNAPVPYPIMQHFVTEMCTCVHISVTKCCIVGYLSDALWDLWDGSIVISYWKVLANTRHVSLYSSTTHVKCQSVFQCMVPRVRCVCDVIHFWLDSLCDTSKTHRDGWEPSVWYCYGQYIVKDIKDFDSIRSNNEFLHIFRNQYKWDNINIYIEWL